MEATASGRAAGTATHLCAADPLYDQVFCTLHPSALQVCQMQEQQSAQANDLASKMAGQAADNRGLNALFEQVGHAAVVNMACV